MRYFIASLFITLSSTTAFLPSLQTINTIARQSSINKVADSIILQSTSISTTQLLLSSENTIIDNSIDAVTSSPQVFEAQLPDSSFFIGIGLVVILCVVASQVWANDVVPISRTKLAISKSRGDVKEYLDELKTSNVDNLDDSIINKTTITIATELNDQSTTINSSNIDKSNELIKPNVGDGRDFERWLFSDWLNKPSSKGGRQKEPALPILKEAKWNSGDNPVLVTAAIMMLGVVLASITERVS